MSEAPKELWADWDYEATDGVCGVHTHKKYASGYEPECPPIRYVRADRIEELEDHLASMAGLWAKSDGEKQLLLGRIEELEAKLLTLAAAYILTGGKDE